MSKKLNISVLVSARDEYIEQLKCIIVPLLIQGFNSIYSDALSITDGKRVIYKFQELLKEIPHWNQTILQEESKRIKRKCSYIMDIVTAIFVSNVKILASIRLKGKNDNIRVKIPTSDIFIHSIYIEAAQQIFYDPFLFYHKNRSGKTQENKEQVRRIIRYSVDETIRQMLPFDDILKEYLANALDDNAESNSEDSSDASTVSDSDEESLHGNNLVDDNEFGSDPDSEPESEPEQIKNFSLNEKFQPLPQVEQSLPQPPPPQQQPQFQEHQFPKEELSDSDDSEESDDSDETNEINEINEISNLPPPQQFNLPPQQQVNLPPQQSNLPPQQSNLPERETYSFF